VTGSIPPMNEDDWESEFALYRASPEFHLLNRNMTLPEFKEIYFMEWTHRLWGRFIGLTFAIPTVYFIARRKVSAKTAARLIGITGLIGFQGFIGWWMVKSGLKDDLFAPGSHPRVSQYRLTAHLGTAIVTYAAMLLSGLRILRSRQVKSMSLKEAQNMFTLLSSPGAKTMRKASTGLSALIFTTAMSGALVAGLDAGLIYNEFPYMGTGLTPPKSELFNPFYVRSSPDEATQFELIWRNMLENPSLVQLDHRILAMTTFTAILGFWGWTRYSAALRAVMVPSVRKRVISVVHMAWVQVALGLSTLLYLVPTPVAAAHQAGALALLTCGLMLRSHLIIPRNLAKIVAQSGRVAARPNPGMKVPGQRPFSSKPSVNAATKEV
jgi:heme a synthase